MDNKVITELTDLRYLNWSHARTSSGTAGTFLKQSDRAVLFDGLEDVLSDIYKNKIWDMIYTRYKIYEAL